MFFYVLLTMFKCLFTKQVHEIHYNTNTKLVQNSFMWITITFNDKLLTYYDLLWLTLPTYCSVKSMKYASNSFVTLLS